MSNDTPKTLKDITIVSMLEFEGKLFVASQDHVYVLRDDKLHPLKFVPLDDIKQELGI